MISLTKVPRVFTCFFSRRYSRTVACLSMSLTLVAIGLLWQPSKRAHAYGRLAIYAPEGENFTLPEAKAGSAYEFQFQTEGGLAPLKWSVGNLPPGLRLEENGKLHGVPTQAQAEAFTFTVTVADSARPPQQFALACLLLVKAAPLRIITTPTRLKILTDLPTEPEQLPMVKKSSEMPAAKASMVATIRPVATTQAETRFQREIFAQRLAKAFTEGQPALSVTEALPAPWEMTLTEAPLETTKGETKKIDAKKLVNPKTFFRIYEDTEGGKRELIYDPTNPEYDSANKDKTQVTKLSADLKSALVIVPVRENLDDDLALNNLYMSASLAPRDADLEVEGYAKIGQSRATGQTQRGFAFQSVRNVIGKLMSMASAADDIVESYDAAKEEDKAKVLEDKVRLYRPNIKATAEFFLDQKNYALTGAISSNVFFADRESLQEVVEQYNTNVELAFNDQTTKPAKAAALLDLLERTRLVNKSFELLKQDVLNQLPEEKRKNAVANTDEAKLIRRQAYLDYGKKLARDAISELKKLIADGSISLTSAEAKDGDLLTLIIEARGIDGETLGIPGRFEIAIKQFGPKPVLTDSFLFIKRLRLNKNDLRPTDATPPGRGLRNINFAPSPGVTFGLNYFQRGNNPSAKFLRALAPGVGVNVSFMNYNDPAFNLVEGRFVNTNGTNVQVGAGIVGMLFNNNIQFSYGYNLNADAARSYFGIGFSFIDFAKTLSNRLKK